MASRDENRSRIAILLELSGSMVLSKIRLFFGWSGYKSDQCSRSNGQIWIRFGQNEAVCYIFVVCKRGVWENSVARERDRIRFSKNVKILQKKN